MSDVDDLRENSALLDPLGFFIDANNCLPGVWSEALSIASARWEFCTRIVLTKSGDDAVIEAAFDCGVNDVLVKPLSCRELLARFRARSGELTARYKASKIRIADLTISPVSRFVQTSRGNRQISQTAFSILLLLLESPGNVIEREVIKDRVWMGARVVDGVIDRHIHDLRKGLAEIGSIVEIKSVYGKGFVLTENHPESRLKMKA